MAMDFTPANRGPTEEATSERPAVSYRPVRTSPSMGSSTAPIPGADKPVQFRGAPQAPATAGEAPGEEEVAPEEMAQRADLSKRLGLVAEKDRRARERIRQASEAEAAQKARDEALAAREARIAEWEARDAERRRDPIRALRDYGYSPEAALQVAVQNGKLTPEQEAALRLDEQLAAEREKTQAELQAIRDEQAKQLEERDAEAERQAKEAEEAAEQSAVEELHADIGEVIVGGKDSFPILAKSKAAAAAVFEAIADWSDVELKKTGRRPQVTTKVIERFVTDLEAQARKEVEELNAELGLAPSPAPRRPQTLTNGAPQRRPTATPERRAAEPERVETEAERRSRVIAQLEEIKRRGGGSLR